MQSPACKLWIPAEDLEKLLEIRRSKRHGYEPVFHASDVKEVEGSTGRLYSAELANQGFLAMLQQTHILAEVGQEALRRGRYGNLQETHVFALVSSRQRHTAYPNGLALTTHPDLDKFSNKGFEVVEVKLPSDKPSLDQFVMEAHATYKGLTQQQPNTQTALNWHRDYHLLVYMVNQSRP